MTSLEKIAFDKLQAEYGQLRFSIEEIISIAENEPERLNGRVQNYGATTYKHQTKEIKKCIDALREGCEQ